MFSQTFQKIAGARQRTLAIIWGSFLMSLIVLTVAAHIVLKKTDTRAATPPPFDVVSMLAAAAVISGAAALGLYRYRSSDGFFKKVLSEKPDVKSMATDPRSRAVNVPYLEQLQSLPLDEIKLVRILSKSQALLLISLALNESVAVLGFCSAIFTRNFESMLPFAGVSLLLALWMPPSQRRLMERAAALAQRGAQG
jgi:hypothetical protein